MSKRGEPRAVRESGDGFDTAIRIGLLVLLIYLSWEIVAPFVTIVMWSAVLTVALYPLFDRIALWTGRSRLAAAIVTILCLAVVVAPVAWLGMGMVDGLKLLASGLDDGQLSLPRPAESVRDWPLIGAWVYDAWTRVETDLRSQLTELAPVLKPIGIKLLQVASNAMLVLVKFLAAIVIAGFLFCTGPRLVAALRRLLERVLRPRGGEMLQLAGTTIRSVSRGVIGVALLQSLLAGFGFVAAGIPGAGILAFLSLLLGVIQIGPGVLFLPILIWSWMTMDTMSALFFTAYMVPVGLLDNVLKPILVAKGLTTPMPVIIVGVIGGTIAHGIIGLFFGPIVLSVAWALLTAWLDGETATGGRDGDG
ncbi:MAG: AI-2E family transporter [Pseudomonadota bacterium]